VRIFPLKAGCKYKKLNAICDKVWVSETVKTPGYLVLRRHFVHVFFWAGEPFLPQRKRVGSALVCHFKA
jgi:hypothetical protein